MHCINHNAYVGCNPPSPSIDHSINRLMDVFSRLRVGPSGPNIGPSDYANDGESGVSLVEGREGPEWRTY
jgi:hypothetical protein